MLTTSTSTPTRKRRSTSPDWEPSKYLSMAFFYSAKLKATCGPKLKDSLITLLKLWRLKRRDKHYQHLSLARMSSSNKKTSSSKITRKGEPATETHPNAKESYPTSLCTRATRQLIRKLLSIASLRKTSLLPTIDTISATECLRVSWWPNKKISPCLQPSKPIIRSTLRPCTRWGRWRSDRRYKASSTKRELGRLPKGKVRTSKEGSTQNRKRNLLMSSSKFLPSLSPKDHFQSRKRTRKNILPKNQTILTNSSRTSSTYHKSLLPTSWMRNKRRCSTKSTTSIRIKARKTWMTKSCKLKKESTKLSLTLWSTNKKITWRNYIFWIRS